MGRTNPTYRDALRAVETRWADYRRALRRRDQPRFDRLFAYAREHADAGGLLNHHQPLFPGLLSVDLEQESRLDAQESRLDGLETRLERLDDLEGRLDDLEGRLDDLEALDGRLTDVEARVAALEDTIEGPPRGSPRTDD